MTVQAALTVMAASPYLFAIIVSLPIPLGLLGWLAGRRQDGLGVAGGRLTSAPALSQVSAHEALHLYQRTPAMLHSMGPELRMVAVSDRWLEVMGYTRDEVIGQSPAVFMTAESARYAREVAWPAFFASGSAVDVAYQYVRRDGSILDVLVSAVLELEADGAPLRSIAAVQDITLRKQAERALTASRDRLQNILEGTNAGTWEWNAQTGELRINQRWAEIIGHTVAELAPMSIATWQTHAHPDDLAESNELLARHFAGELERYDCVSRMRHKAGHWVYVHDRGKVVSRDARGEPLWVMGTRTDVTEMKLAEAQLEHALHQAEAASSAKSAMVRAISHELRTPLNGVLGVAQLLELGELEAQSREYLAALRESATRLNEAVSRLLDIGRLEDEKFALVNKPLDPQGIIEATVHAARLKLLPGGVTINAEVGPLPGGLRGDPERLRQMLVHLIDNAVRHTSQGAICVRCRAVAVADDDAALRVEVEDTGSGIPSALLSVIFERFRRTDERPSAAHHALGLGLWNVRLLARRMGGEAGVESTEGVGSLFWFSVRLQRESPSTVAAEGDAVA